MRYLALALLLPSLASAQGLTTLAPGQAGAGKVLWSKSFGTVGCFASGTDGIAITRATAATYWDGAATQSCAAGSYRVEADGLLVEPIRSNFVLSSTTHPKTGEATASVGTGLFQARHQGTGTMTLVAGTATVTGLSCTAVAAGTVCTGTVTVAGTLAITTTPGTTRAQVETGAYPTSWIDNASAVSAAVRNADQVSATVPSVPSKWCIAVTATPYLARAWQTGASWVWTLGTFAGANSATFLEQGVNTARLRVFDSSAAAKTGISPALTPSVVHRFVSCDTAGSLSMAIDGAAVTLTAADAGTGIMATSPTTFYLGAAGASGYYGGYLKSFKICSAKSWRECK